MTQQLPQIAAVLAVTPEQLATMTEPEIDWLNAALDAEYARRNVEQARAWDRLFAAVGEEKEQRGRRRVYTTPRNEVEEKARALVADPPAEAPAHLKRYAPSLTADKYVQRVASALRDLDAVGTKIAELSQGPRSILSGEWTRRGGWPRFFSVTSSNDGHTHKTNSRYGCSSFRDSTTFGWHPELSGLTEAEAVKALGPTLCSLCFPSAPTEWRRDPEAVKAEAEAGKWCAGSGEHVELDASMARRVSKYAKCPTCGESVSVTSTWKLRKHKAKAAPAVETAPEAPAAEPVQVEVTLYRRADATVYGLVRADLPQGARMVDLLADTVRTAVSAARKAPGGQQVTLSSLIAVATVGGQRYAADGDGQEYEVSIQLSEKSG
ncbi:hypothetical protein [Streptomyces sp. cg35]|uniref:hypothetical protein n=1 Tax=Streptomyces sp. cg35 TaxID=3421650 RepID=UPI003D183BA1